jgi:hypothetical protein
MEIIKKIVRILVPQAVWNKRKVCIDKQQLLAYTRKGGSTPHIVKQMAIAEYQQKYGYGTLIETGTYLGDMIEAQKKRFTHIISIELDPT